MTDVRLAGSHLEVLGGTSTPDRKIAGVNLEVLGGVSNPGRKLAGVYLEILVKAEPINFSPSGSSVFDSTGIERPVWRWDGTKLIPAKLFQT